MVNNPLKKSILTIVLLATSISFGWYYFVQQKKVIEAPAPIQAKCEFPKGFEKYTHDDSKVSANPLFELSLNLPAKLIIAGGSDRAGDGVSEYLEIPFVTQQRAHSFDIELFYLPKATNTLDYILKDRLVRLESYYPKPEDNLSKDQIVITKISSPEELVQKGMGRAGCIDEFWSNVDEVYMLEPKTSMALEYFEEQGIIRYYGGPAGEQEEPLLSPFGLYASRSINGIPLILHFVWVAEWDKFYTGHSGFFRDKPYSVFDVLWSVRLDVVK